MGAYGGGGGGGGGAWRIIPVRSLRTAQSAPPPHSGGGAADHVTEVGELAEVVHGGVEFSDGETLLDVPIEMCGEGAAAPEVASGRAEAAHWDSSRFVYERTTAVALPIFMAGRDLVACAQTGPMAAFYFPVGSGPVAEAAPGGLRGYGHWDQGSFDRSAELRLRALVVTHTGELAAQMHNQEKSAHIDFDIPGPIVDMVEKSLISHEAPKYLVIDDAGMILDMRFESQRRMIVYMMNLPSFPPERQMLDSDLLSKNIFITVVTVGSSTDLIVQKIEFVNDEEKRVLLLDLLHNQSVGMACSMEADSLRFWLFSKGFPATEICGDRTQQRTSVLSNYMCITVRIVGSDTDMFEQKIEFVDNWDKRCFLQDLLCKKSGSLCRPLIASFQSAAWLYLFIAIMFLLIPRSTLLPITDNKTEICPAPYMQFKRPVPIYVPRLFKPEDLGYQEILMLDNTSTEKSYYQQWALILGPIISFLANFAPLITAQGISNVAANNILLQGFSCLLFAEANLSWTFYLLGDDKNAGTVVFYSAIFAAVLNAFWSVLFWKKTSLDAKQTMLALLACVITGTISYAYFSVAGVFALICLLCGHFFRIKCMCNVQKFHGFTWAMSFLGLGGSICSLYGAGVGPVTIPKVFSTISITVRMIDIPLQAYFRCCNEQAETPAGPNGSQPAEGDEQRRELALNEPLLHPGPNISQNSINVDRIDVLDDEQSDPSLGLNDGDMHASTDTPRSSSLSGHLSGSISDYSTEDGSEASDTNMVQAERNGITDVASADMIPSSIEQASGVEDCEAAPSDFNGHETMETSSLQANWDGSIDDASRKNISNSVEQASDCKDSGLAHSQLTTRMSGKLENDNN